MEKDNPKNREEQNNEKLSNYMGLGMCFGAMAGCVGMCILAMFGQIVWGILCLSIALPAGMLTGMAIPRRK